MSSPRSIGGSSGLLGVREGTRIVLREITASLHNSSPQPPRRKSANDTPAVKATEHEIKVQFTREFADVGPSSYSGPESLSSASSFQSLASTLSSKSSSGICVDSGPNSLQKAADESYVDAEIPGVEDLIFGCGNIQLIEQEYKSCRQDLLFSDSNQSSQELSQDQTFTSATDESNSSLITDLSEQNVHVNTKDSSVNLKADLSVLNCELNSSITSNSDLNRTRESCTSVSDVLHENNISFDQINESLEQFQQLHKSEDLSSIVKTSNEVEILAINSLITSNETTDLNVNLSESESSEDLKVNRSGEAHVITPSELVINSSLLNASPSVLTSTEHEQSPLLPNISGNSSEVKDDIVKPPESSAKDVTDVLNSVSSNLLYSADKVPNDSTSKHSPVVPYEIQEQVSSVVTHTTENIAENIQETKQKTNDTVLEVPALENPEHVSECTSETIEERVIKDRSEVTDQINKNQSVDSVASISQDSKDLLGQTLQEKNEEKASTEVAEKNLVILSETITIENDASVVEDDVNNKEQSLSDEELDRTITLHDISINFDTPVEPEQYDAFQPQQQSTGLGANDRCNFDELKLAAQAVANDIYNSSLEVTEESDQFVSATCEIFQDPSCFDFLLTRSTDLNSVRDLRAESLYVKFDPLVSNEIMLPQGNTLPTREEENCKSKSPVSNVGTPKHSPAVMAIDRLLFYSPICTKLPLKVEETQETNVPKEESEPDTVPVIDANMVKELELVRSTVLRLEEELEKQKKEHEAELEKRKKEHEAELEKQKVLVQEKINRLQVQLAQEIKNKNQMTVVVDEYEKSISRLVAEKERDRANLEQEKSKLQEELQAANHHLTNTEAAFNDVHLKYERLKGVVSAYKSNEIVLKESIQENEITIKALENRYDQLKSHAMAQLEKANLELDSIRKQNESETVRLHAMVRKAELKSNSLAEMVEQKGKENKELAQILDEFIARVGRQNAD